MKEKKEVKITKKHIKKRHKLAWKVWSKFIRNRDGGICISCGAKDDIRKMQAGHFCHGHLFDFNFYLINCQCARCNWRLHGNLGRYAIALIKKYGIEKVEEEIRLAEEHKGYTLEEIEEVIKKYGGK